MEERERERETEGGREGGRFSGAVSCCLGGVVLGFRVEAACSAHGHTVGVKERNMEYETRRGNVFSNYYYYYFFLSVFLSESLL